MKKFNTKAMVTLAVLTALSIVLDRLLSVPIGTNIRIHLGVVPVMLAGIWYGPIAGGVVGGLADFLGASVLSGLGFFPLLIISPILKGVIPGLMGKLALDGKLLKVALVVFVNAVVTALLVTPLVLSYMYGNPFWTVFVSRLPFVLLQMALEIAVVYLMIKWQKVSKLKLA